MPSIKMSFRKDGTVKTTMVGKITWREVLRASTGLASGLFAGGNNSQAPAGAADVARQFWEDAGQYLRSGSGESVVAIEIVTGREEH